MKNVKTIAILGTGSDVGKSKEWLGKEFKNVILDDLLKR